MKVSIDLPKQSFALKVVGVTYQNHDGTNRQNILKNCKSGQKVKLVREPNNKFDKFAIAVFTLDDKQIGYLPKGDAKLANHIDRGGKTNAVIKEITGGSGFLGLFISAFRKSYGCVLKITKEDIDWKAVAPYMDIDRKAKELINKAKNKETSQPIQAVKLYREAVAELQRLDSQGEKAVAWRTTRYPINRLSLILEKLGKTNEALEEIKKYETFNDRVGLSKSDEESLKKRKNRLG
ncbi:MULTISPECIES: HIRAN domain-containing protein [unclassified Nitrospina]|uniref:HIRAN domain-containing protein n=1 Tax=unclassified Nitrospina TaxID=2638683 RepID=UPI003F981BDF